MDGRRVRLNVMGMLNARNQNLVDLITDRTVVAVWAHPDDESFLAGGLMLAAAASGSRVVNVTATLGELGTDDPHTWTPERLGRRRKDELARALDELGAAELVTLGVRDGSCEELDYFMGARRVATVLDCYQPDLIVTFGPDGVTGHPDHQAVGRWTDLAADFTDPSVPVLHTATASTWPADLLAPMNDIGAFFPGFPDLAPAGHDWQLDLPEAHLDAKLAALNCHQSQIGPLRERLGDDGLRRLFAVEAYRPANAAAATLPPSVQLQPVA